MLESVMKRHEDKGVETPDIQGEAERAGRML